MKIDGVIILTLTDFRRHFNFPSFWNSRLSFVRDLGPNSIFYSDKKDEERYIEIVKWIKAEHDGISTDELRKNGLKALSIYAGCNVTEKDYKKAVGMLDFSSDIITVSGDDKISLPGTAIAEDDIPEYVRSKGKKEKLHKIEIEGDEDRVITIFIGGTEVAHVKSMECLYVTEIDGEFIRALPNRLTLGPYVLTMENNPGKFESTLLEEYYAMGCTEIRHKHITHFAYNKNKKPVFSSEKYYSLNYEL